MKYTLITEESATECASYIRTVTFSANSFHELDELLTKFCNGIENPCIVIDDSQEPPNFACSGGFATTVISFIADNGDDLTNFARDCGI